MERLNLTELYYEIVHELRQILLHPDATHEQVIRAATQLRQMIPVPPAPDKDEESDMQAFNANISLIEDKLRDECEERIKQLKLNNMGFD